MIITLFGYMGCGKSLLGKLLAKNLNYAFIDLDLHIENLYGMRVKDIFHLKGEVYFRKIESETLKKVCRTQANTVLSLGGGTPCYGNNLSLLKQNLLVKSFYIKLSNSVLSKRLKLSKKKRPLISEILDKNLDEFVSKHLFERSVYYNQADQIIDADHKSKEQIINEIKACLS